MEQIDPFKKEEPISETEIPVKKRKKAAPRSRYWEPTSKEELDGYYESQFGKGANPYSEERNKAAARKASEKVLGKEGETS